MQVKSHGFTVGLDAPAEIPFLSHAHSDHMNGMKKLENIISSEATLELGGLKSRMLAVGWARMFDAGHILGARQLFIEGDGESIVYTGDFCTKPNTFGWKAEIRECDHLIMEATYGNPEYIFPDMESVHANIAKWVIQHDTSNLLLGGYELGKSQEIVHILNECGIAPIVTEKMDKFSQVYEHHGVHLDRVVVGSAEAEEIMSRRFVAVVPMSRAKRYFAYRLAKAFERPTLCAVATGWALHYRFDTDAAFPLSDHSDFNDLVNYIEETGAQKIEFFCGDGSRVLDALRSKNGAILNS